MKKLGFLTVILMGQMSLAAPRGACLVRVTLTDTHTKSIGAKFEETDDHYILKEIMTLPDGQKLTLRVEPYGPGGYMATLSTPIISQFPPVSPTFFLRGVGMRQGDSMPSIIVSHGSDSDKQIKRAHIHCHMIL